MAIVRYAGNRMTGVSGDTKPTSNLITGTTFHETNTDDLYIWDGDSWNIVAGDSIAQTLSNKTLTSPVLNTSLSGTAFLDEDNFDSDAADKVASQQSIKAYVASQVPGSQNVFNTIAVSGQDNVVADGATDTLTFAAGNNITLTTTAGTDTVTIAASSSSATVTVTDNESTNENNLITFVADASTTTGAKGLEMDGDFHYNPSTGRLTATQLSGTLQTAAQTNITSVGALDGGSITSGFTSIDVGSGAITTTGLISGGSLDIDDVLINGTTIGHTDDTDLLTVANGLLTVAGEISVTTLDIGGTNVASTAAELNIMDGNTSATSTALDDADRVVVNDAGTMVQVALTDFETYFESALDTLSNVTTVGALDAGSITSGFTSIDVGSGAISTTGTITAGNLDVTGTTTTVNSTNTTISDRLIELANGATASTADAGIIVERGSTGDNAIMAWDESTDRFVFGTTTATGASTGDLTITAGTVQASTFIGNLTGDVTGTADEVTVSANNSNNETVYLTFVDAATGSQEIETDTGLTYNPSTGLLTTAQLGAFTATGAIDFGDQNMTNVDIDSGDIRGVTISGALTWSSAQNLNSQILTNVNIDSGDISAATISGGLTWTSAQNLNSQVLTGVNIDGGAIDNVTIGTNNAITELRVDNLTLNGNTIISSDSNGHINLTPNGTGSVVIAKADINAGTIDNTTIGATTASTAVVTSITTPTALLTNGTNANAITINTGATAANYTITMPTAAPAQGKVLKTTSGSTTQLEWGDAGTSGASEAFAIAMAVAL